MSVHYRYSKKFVLNSLDYEMSLATRKTSPHPTYILLMESVEKWLNPQATDFIDIGIKILFSDISASVSAVTSSKSSLSMYVFLVYNNKFLIACFIKSSRRLLSE